MSGTSTFYCENTILKINNFLSSTIIEPDQDLSIFLEKTFLTTDSRKVSSNSIFIAIKGATVDGHDFIKDLPNECICVCQQGNPATQQIKNQKNLFFVKDTFSFAQDFAPIFYEISGC